MKTVLKYSLIAAALAFVSTSSASAKPRHKDPDPPCKTAPEVDPGMAISGLSLLGGTLTVLNARRAK